MKSVDRVEFYEQLKYCKTREDIEKLIDDIDNDDLRNVMLDKYNQVIEFNKAKADDKLVKDIIKVLEYSFLRYESTQSENTSEEENNNA